MAGLSRIHETAVSCNMTSCRWPWGPRRGDRGTVADPIRVLVKTNGLTIVGSLWKHMVSLQAQGPIQRVSKLDPSQNIWFHAI